MAGWKVELREFDVARGDWMPVLATVVGSGSGDLSPGPFFLVLARVEAFYSAKHNLLHTVGIVEH
jgi:hypothetical protein